MDRRNANPTDNGNRRHAHEEEPQAEQLPQLEQDQEPTQVQEQQQPVQSETNSDTTKNCTRNVGVYSINDDNRNNKNMMRNNNNNNNNSSDTIGLEESAVEDPLAFSSSTLSSTFQLSSSSLRGDGGGGGEGGDVATTTGMNADDAEIMAVTFLSSLSSSSSSSAAAAFWGAAANMCSATLGVGILSLPQACAQAGWIWSAILLLVSVVATIISIQLLVMACTRYQLYTYESLTEVLYGPWLRRISQASIVIFCQGCSVAFIMALADILEQTHFLLWESRSWTLILLWTTVLLPLSLFRTMAALQWSSAVGVAAVGTLVYAAIIHCIDDTKNMETQTTYEDPSSPQLQQLLGSWGRIPNHPHYKDSASYSHNHSNWTTTSPTDSPSDSAAFDWSSMLWPQQGVVSVLTACPIILFAFSAQVNVCAIYEELVLIPNAAIAESVAATTSCPPDNPPSIGGINSGGENRNLDRQLEEQKQQEEEGLCRMYWVTVVAMGVSASLYTGISVAAVADFGVEGVTPNILQAYPHPLKGIIQVAAVGMILAVITALPLNIFPSRVTLDGMLPSLSDFGCCSKKSQSRQRRRHYNEQRLQNVRNGNQDNEEEEVSGSRCRGCCRCPCFQQRPDNRHSQPNPILTEALLSDEEASPVRQQRINDRSNATVARVSFIHEEEYQPQPQKQQEQQSYMRVIDEGDEEEHDSLDPLLSVSTPERQPCAEPQPSQHLRTYNNSNVAATEEAPPSPPLFPWCRHVFLTLLLNGSALGIALIVPDISVVFQILGGTVNSVLGFCIPGMLGLRLGRDWVPPPPPPPPRQHHPTIGAANQDPTPGRGGCKCGSNSTWILCCSWLLIVGGALLGVVTTVVTIQQLCV